MYSFHYGKRMRQQNIKEQKKMKEEQRMSMADSNVWIS